MTTTSDNGVDIKKAIEDSTILGERHYCLSHCINLIVQKGANLWPSPNSRNDEENNNDDTEDEEYCNDDDDVDEESESESCPSTPSTLVGSTATPALSNIYIK